MVSKALATVLAGVLILWAMAASSRTAAVTSESYPCESYLEAHLLPSGRPTAYPTAVAASPQPSPARAADLTDVPSHADPALESALPKEFGGETLVVVSTRGADMTDESQFSTMLLKQLGREAAEYSQAAAFHPSGAIPDQEAIRVLGIPGEQLLVPWLETYGAALAGGPATCEWITSNGHDVLIVSSFESRALVPVPDALVVLQAFDLATLEELIESTTSLFESR